MTVTKVSPYARANANGVGHALGRLCAIQNTAHVLDSIMVVMSGSVAYIVAQYAANAHDIYGSNLAGVAANTPLNVAGGGAALKIELTDRAGQALPAGIQTSIHRARPGSTALIVVNNDDTTTNAGGALTIKVETPKGIVAVLTIPLNT